MKYREATIDDIPQLQMVRNSVRENVLSNPEMVTDGHYEEYLTLRGKGWICEVDGAIAGFAIADLRGSNIWALFLNPEFEGQGIAGELHEMMLDWYFSQGKENVWLGTTPHTRAEKFYRRKGWQETGLHGDEEIKFEMTREMWFKNKSRTSSRNKEDGH